jgi:cobalt-zinc-cadmium efflux system membrane fusion protein
MQRFATVLLLTLAVALPACRGGEGAEAEQTAHRSAAASADGAMCREHGVLEAVCTRCNPALVTVFKAKGDWCEEHGFPESFCPLCHPERGGRPAANVDTSKDGPADGTMVRFRTKDTARLAGLQLSKAVEHPTRRELEVTARVVYDAARVAQVNPRMPGVVRALQADVGTSLRAGDALVLIESADVGAEQSRLQAARSRLELSEANYKRVETLHADGISPERALALARGEREQARAEVRAAQGALGMVGARAEGLGRYTLTAPIAGVVTQRNATIGRLVDREDLLFEIVDPSAMWIDLDVPEGDLPLVAAGQSVTVTLDGLPGRELRGTLSYVAPAIDLQTRTAVARLPVQNADGALRANQFGRARIAVSDPRVAVLVPRSAVQRARGVSLVFVRVAEDAYEARRVAVGPASGERVSVSGRVAVGDDVVTEGSFLLKTETLKESIGAGCCE